MLHALGVYYITYSYMVSGPNFKFRKVIRNFWHQDRHLFLELIQGAFWVKNCKNDGFTKMSVDSWKLYIVGDVSSSMEAAREMHCKDYSIFKLYCKKFVAPRSTVFNAADCNLQIFIWHFVIKNVCSNALSWNKMFMLDEIV